MNMATPTIKKESFFEYNPVRKRNLSCEFFSGFELLCFSMAGRSAGHRSAVEKQRSSNPETNSQLKFLFRTGLYLKKDSFLIVGVAIFIVQFFTHVQTVLYKSLFFSTAERWPANGQALASIWTSFET